MNKKNKWLLTMACACISLGSMTGCEGMIEKINQFLPPELGIVLPLPNGGESTSEIELNLVEESVEMELFEELDLEYTYTGEEALSWSVADPSVVTVSNGKLVALKQGETTVTVQSGDVSDVCSVKVNGMKKELLSVAVEKAQPSLYIGESDIIKPTVTYGMKIIEDATFTYESFDTAVASVSQAGVLTANSVGTTSVSVTATAMQTTVGCIVNVTVQKSGAISVDTVMVELYALPEYDGKTYKNEIQLQTTVTEKGVEVKPDSLKMSWTSSDASVATVENGKVVAVGLGDAQITVTYVGSDGYSVEAVSFITVLPVTHTVETTTNVIKTELFTVEGLETEGMNAYLTDGTLNIPVPVSNGELDFSTINVYGETTLVLDTGKILLNMPIYVWTDVISNMADFTALRTKRDGHYRLETDLDFTGVTWTYETPVVFKGVLDGGDHTLTNFAPSGCGLFYELGGESKIQNLNFKNAMINAGNNSIGCLASIVSPDAIVTVENVTGNIVNNGNACGGLFGRVGANVELTLARNNLHIYAENTAAGSGALVGCADSEIIMSSDAPSAIYTNFNLCGNTAYSGFTNSASTAINQNTYEKPQAYKEVLNKWNKNELAGTKIAISETNVVKATFFGKTIEVLPYDNGVVLPAAQVEGFEGNNYEIMLEKADGTIAYYAVKIEYGELKLSNANKHLLKEINSGTVILQEDIDLGGETWSEQGHFAGTLDGNGHVIKNFTIPSKDSWGFFVTAIGTIKNIGFVGVKLEKGASVIAARNGSGTLTLENVFIEVVEVADPTATYGILGKVRKNEKSVVTMTNVVASMPSNKAKIFGVLAQYQTQLTNVYTIGISTSAPYAGSVQVAPTATDCGHYADLAEFNGATKTLTPFLTSCVEKYLK